MISTKEGRGGRCDDGDDDGDDDHTQPLTPNAAKTDEDVSHINK